MGHETQKQSQRLEDVTDQPEIYRQLGPLDPNATQAEAEAFYRPVMEPNEAIRRADINGEPTAFAMRVKAENPEASMPTSRT